MWWNETGGLVLDSAGNAQLNPEFIEELGGDYDPDTADGAPYEITRGTDIQEAYEKGLNIMDMTAFTLCQENNLPIIVFDMNKPGNLMKILNGEPAGTLIT